MDTIAIKRLIWHSRRGMLELDMLLEPFARNVLATLEPNEQANYASLLTHQDPDIYMWLMGQTECPEQDLAKLIAKIQAYAATHRHS